MKACAPLSYGSIKLKQLATKQYRNFAKKENK